MTQQDLVENICMQTGISKRDLAKWIGTDHSVLCRYTAGTRSLPLRPLQQLLFLHQQVAELPALPVDEPAEINKAEWQQQIENCSAKLNSLQERYIAMRQNWKRAAKAQQLLKVLAADAVMLNQKKERWIEEQQYLAEKVAIDSQPKEQQRLKLQIALLQAEIELYKTMLKDENTGA